MALKAKVRASRDGGFKLLERVGESWDFYYTLSEGRKKSLQCNRIREE